MLKSWRSGSQKVPMRPSVHLPKRGFAPYAKTSVQVFSLVELTSIFYLLCTPRWLERNWRIRMKNNKSKLPVIPINIEDLPEQVCRWINGFMNCNYVIRNGKVIKSKSGKNLHWPCPRRKKSAKNQDVDLIQKEKEPAVKQGSKSLK